MKKINWPNVRQGISKVCLAISVAVGWFSLIFLLVAIIGDVELYLNLGLFGCLIVFGSGFVFCVINLIDNICDKGKVNEDKHILKNKTKTSKEDAYEKQFAETDIVV